MRGIHLPLLLASSLLAAQGARFGAQVGISSPQNDADDLVDGRLGFTFGLCVTFESKGAHVLRPRLDWTRHRHSQSGVDLTNETLFLGTDYNVYPSGQAGKGAYFLVGVGAAQTRVKLGLPGWGSDSEDKTAFAWALGAGWQFSSRMGAELRYVSTHPNFGGSSAYKNDAINLGMTFRF